LRPANVAAPRTTPATDPAAIELANIDPAAIGFERSTAPGIVTAENSVIRMLDSPIFVT
jgi:hypothetical protein